MKNRNKRILSFLLALLLCLPVSLTAFANTDAPLEGEGAEDGGATEGYDYESLYVTDVDGDDDVDATLLWSALDKKEGDTLSETKFDVNASASYGNGYLFNNSAALDLTAYLPNFEYGEHTAQRDFTVEIVMSARPVEGTSVNNSFRWYFGNYQAAFQYRQKDNPDLSRGILTTWNNLADFVADGSGGVSINGTSNPKFDVFGNTLNRAYTQTFTFDLTLGETPDKTKDTMKLVFYRDGVKLEHPDSITGPLAYDATDGLKDNRLDDTLLIGGNAALDYYAIRVYEGVLTEEQIRQNHFADLASYLKLDMAAFEALTEEERALLYAFCADIALTDADAEDKIAEAFGDIIIDALYVRDVDGDGTDDIAFFYDAYGHTAADGTTTSIVDRLGKTVTLSSGFTYTDHGVYAGGKSIELTSFYDKTKDAYLELVISQTGNPVVGAGSSTMAVGPTKVVPYPSGTPVDASYGVVSKTYWYASEKEQGAFEFDSAAAPTHYFGERAGVIYSVGAGVKKDFNANTYTDFLMRDSAIFKESGASKAYSVDSDTNGVKFGANFNLNYHAIRLYTAIPTEAQMKQNHFADLLSFYRPTELTYFGELSDYGKKQVQKDCEDLRLGDEGAENVLKTAILEVYQQEKDEVYLASFFMGFEGYAMRLFGERDLRISYTVNQDYIASLDSNETVSLLELGVLVTEVGAEQGNAALKKANLTLDYAEKNDFAEKYTLYSADEAGATIPAGYDVIVNCGNDVDSYAQDYMVRGYVTINLRGTEVTLYEDAVSKTLGDTVSLVSLSAAVYESTADYADAAPESVLESVITEAEDVFASFVTPVEEAKRARLDAEALLEEAKWSANELKDDLKAISLEGVEADDTKKAELQAEAAELLAGITAIREKAASTHPNLGIGGTISTLKVKAEHYVSLLTLASDVVGSGADVLASAEEITAAVAAEAKAQEAGFSNNALRYKQDVTDALALAEKIGADIAAGTFKEIKTLKVLSIGNSFSNNATSQLYQIAKQFDYEDIVIGVLYIGGCSIETHYNNALSGAVAYDYRKNTSGSFRVLKSTMLDGVTDEEWDFITFQQVSQLSAVESSLTDGKLDYLIEHVQENMISENTKLYYHATWSYAEGHAHSYKDEPGYEFLKDQALMDSMILDCMDNAILTRDDIDGVIYAGVSIAEARKHFGNGFELYGSTIKNGVETDGYHLNVKGCYIAGLTWFGTLTGEDVSSATATSTCTLTGDDLTAAINAAKVGIAHTSSAE